jgi:SAM-dependent methyltransferase
MNLCEISTRAARKLFDRYEEWRDDAVDRKYGIDTRGTLESAPIVARDHRYHYAPIQLAVFEQIMQALPADPAGLTFIDFGSGKGRALVLAALRGFRRVIGIEYDRDLHLAAQRNVEHFRSRVLRSGPIELHCADAVRYELPGEDCLCFFYNPFDDVVMAQVLTRIGDSLRGQPRRFFAAYRNPRHGQLLAAAQFLRCLARNRSFELYEGTAR